MMINRYFIFKIIIAVFALMTISLNLSVIQSSDSTIEENAISPLAKAVSNTADKFKSSNSTNRNMALVAAMGMITAGGYGYYFYDQEIKPTEKLIDDSLSFLHQLLMNPLFLKARNTGFEVLGMEDSLNQIKLNMLRALGLKESYLNPTGYINRLVNESRQNINNLFNLINKTITQETDLEKLAKDIKAAAMSPSINLLKAKNSIEKPKKEIVGIIPEELIELKTIDKNLAAVSMDDAYNLPENVLKNKKYILNSYNFFRNIIENPLKYNCRNNDCDNSLLISEGEKIKNLKSEFYNIFYGNNLYNNYIESYVESKKAQEYKMAEKIVFNRLFEALQISIAPRRFPIAANLAPEEISKKIQEYAKQCRYVILKRLNDLEKWIIIEDHLRSLHEVSNTSGDYKPN